MSRNLHSILEGSLHILKILFLSDSWVKCYNMGRRQSETKVHPFHPQIAKMDNSIPEVWHVHYFTKDLLRNKRATWHRITIWFCRRRFLKIVTIYCREGYLGHVTTTIQATYISPKSWRLYTTKCFNQQSPFGGDVWSCWNTSGLGKSQRTTLSSEAMKTYSTNLLHIPVFTPTFIPNLHQHLYQIY